MSSKLLYDTDYDFRSEDGVVNIRDIYALDGKLASVNIHPLYIADEYRVYNIGKKYTEADIEALRKTHELEWAKINTIIFPKEVFPQLYVAMKEFLGNIYYSTRTLEAYEREVICKPMLFNDFARRYYES